ncbi:MAG: SAM-dependent methyltransferase [Herpetosiphonaceae bacterium]|nr:MAG: SAM-dependent methyltransferase [Herpetosiphonaceae bacterium]
MKLPEIVLPLQLKGRLRAGHPWIYRDHVPAGLNYPSGTWLRLRCGGWSGYGLWDAQSPIAIRVFSQRQIPDARWVYERVQAAWLLREPVRNSKTTAYRWLFGEADWLPGLTVDLYGHYAVLQTYAESVDVLVPWVVEALRRITPLRGILRRSQASLQEVEDHQRADQKAHVLWGGAPPADLVVLEHGLKFRANLFAGQKTGLFLDHRENRRYLENYCAGRRVLNCFSYTGAFSVYAARGGAAEVTSVDIAPASAEEARANVRLNGLDPQRHHFLVEDVFDLLGRYAQQGLQFDLIILDPPSFARGKRHVHAAVRAYTRLNQLALRCLPPGGLLATASCTSQVSPEMFRELLAEAAAGAGCRLRIVHDAGQPVDHPVPAHFLEGRYLKFMLCVVDQVV